MTRQDRSPNLVQRYAVLATVKTATRRNAVAQRAILDRGCGRRRGDVRPGRRNGACQPNKET